MRIDELWFGYRRLCFPLETQSIVFRILHENKFTERDLRITEGEFSFITDGRSYRKLADILSCSGIAFQADEVRGLPRFFRFCRGRIGLLFGFTLALAILLFCRSRVWEVRIVGDGTIDMDMIRESLYQAGLREGMAISSLDGDAVAASYLMMNPAVSWINIHVDGVVAEVEWMAVKPGDEAVGHQAGIGANLTAVCDAVVTDIRPVSGTPVVKVGQVVHKGDLLISGVKDNRIAYAEGEVFGKVTRTVSVLVPFLQQRDITKSRTTEALSLTVFGRSFSIFEKKADGVTEESALWLPFGIKLPIGISRVYSYTTEQKDYRLTEEEAVMAAMHQLNAEISAFLAEGELLSRKTEGMFTEEGYYVKAEIEYLINIAKTLEFSAKND